MTKNLSESVAVDIRNRILCKQYIPGVKLPNEYELAEEFGVCRYTIREAVKKLVAVGLITVERGKGTFVNETLESSYFSPIIQSLVLMDKNVDEILEARLAIEYKTVSLAAERATRVEIAGMKKTLERLHNTVNDSDVKLHNQLDLQLHGQIALASNNRILVEILKILYDLIAYTIEMVPGDLQKRIRSMEGHERIISAIERHEPQLAADEMYKHLDFCRQLYLGS